MSSFKRLKTMSKWTKHWGCFPERVKVCDGRWDLCVLLVVYVDCDDSGSTWRWSWRWNDYFSRYCSWGSRPSSMIYTQIHSLPYCSCFLFCFVLYYMFLLFITDISNDKTISRQDFFQLSQVYYLTLWCMETSNFHIRSPFSKMHVNTIHVTITYLISNI